MGTPSLVLRRVQGRRASRPCDIDRLADAARLIPIETCSLMLR